MCVQACGFMASSLRQYVRGLKSGKGGRDGAALNERHLAVQQLAAALARRAPQLAQHAGAHHAAVQKGVGLICP